MFSLMLSFLLTTVELHFCRGFSDGYRYDDNILSAYQTIGFFSKCSENVKANETALSLLAIGMENELRQVLEFQKNFNFISYDVCDDTERLVELITDLYLDRRYFLSSSDNIHKPTNQQKALSTRDQNIIFIIAYVTDEMSNIIQSILGNLNPIIARLCIPHQCDSRFPFSNMDEYIGQILDFVLRFSMRDLTFINIERRNAEPTGYETYYNKVYHSLTSKNFCLRRKTIHVSHGITDYDNEYSERLLKELITPFLNQKGSNKSNIIFFGRAEDVRSIAHKMAYDFQGIRTSRSILFQDIGFVSSDNENLIRLYFAGRLNNLFNSEANIVEHSRLFDLLIDYADMILTALKEFLSDDSPSEGILHEVYHYRVPHLSNNFILPLGQYDSSGKEGAIGTVLSEKFLEEARFKQVYCQPNLTCPPGHHKQYGVVNITRDADEEHAFRCDLCPLNTIKIGYGDGSCVPCVGKFNIDDGERTVCVDPFTDVKMLFVDQQHHATVAFAGFGTLINIGIIILFIIKRKTPIVRSSDKALSLLHLVSLLGVFLGVNSLYSLPYLEVGICIGRNLIYSIPYTFHVACLYTKSQKLVTAFSSNIRLSAGSFRKTLMIQTFTIIILVLSSNCGLFVSYVQIAPRLISQLDATKMTRNHSCNTEFHQNIQIVLLTSCQLMCSAQAYRCRRLPNLINEAMSLFYTILITSVSFGVSFPMSHFRREPMDKEFVGVSVILINCYVTLLLMYGKKCYTMMFQPEKNTRVYFNSKRREHNGV